MNLRKRSPSTRSACARWLQRSFQALKIGKKRDPASQNLGPGPVATESTCPWLKVGPGIGRAQIWKLPAAVTSWPTRCGLLAPSEVQQRSVQSQMYREPQSLQSKGIVFGIGSEVTLSPICQRYWPFLNTGNNVEAISNPGYEDCAGEDSEWTRTR
jgi:hypothetical protein